MHWNRTMTMKEARTLPRVEQFLGELETDVNWTNVIDVRWFKFRADEFYKDGDGPDKVTVVRPENPAGKTVLPLRFWPLRLPTNMELMSAVSDGISLSGWMKCLKRMTNSPIFLIV